MNCADMNCVRRNDAIPWSKHHLIFLTLCYTVLGAWQYSEKGNIISGNLQENTYRLRDFLVGDYDNIGRIADRSGSSSYIREHHHGNQGMFRINAHRLAESIERKKTL